MVVFPPLISILYFKFYLYVVEVVFALLQPFAKKEKWHCDSYV